MDKEFTLYDCLLAQVTAEDRIREALFRPRWAYVSTEASAGIAMATPGDSIAPLFPAGLAGLTLSAAASAVKSWNLQEASLAMAAINAALSTPARVEALSCYVPIETHYTDDLDFAGKTVALIGHMHGTERMWQQAKQVLILERSPQPGDYPDTACEYLLPRCDIVLISGSTLINKTLPRLLQLCRSAYTILTGPTVPLCPELLDCGIDRLAGMAVTDPARMREHAAGGLRGSPYAMGMPFILSK